MTHNTSMKTLEDYLHTAQTAKSTTPLLSPHELRSMVEQSSRGSVQTSPGAPPLVPLSKTTMIGSTLGALCLSAALWMWLGHPNTPTAQSDNQPVAQATASGAQNSQGDFNTRAASQPLDDNSTKRASASAGLGYALGGNCPLIFPDRQECDALGIHVVGDSVSTVLEELYVEDESPASAKAFINELQYPLNAKKLILRANIAIKPHHSFTDPIKYDRSWDVSEPMGFSPYAAVFFTEHDGGVTSSIATCDHSAYLSSLDVNREFKREFKQMMHDVEGELDKDFFTKPELPLAKRPYKYLRYIVPLAFDFSQGDDHKMAVFFYVPTKEFLQELNPKHRLQLAALSAAAGSKHLAIPYSGVSTAIEEQKIPTPSSIAGIEYLQLSAEELQKLGVTMDQGTVRFSMDDFNTRDNGANTTETVADERQAERRAKRVLRERQELSSVYSYDTAHATILFRQDVQLPLGQDNKHTIVPYNGWSYTQPNPLSPVGYQSVEVSYQPSKRHSGFDHSEWIDQQLVGVSPLLHGNAANFVQPGSNGRLVNTGATIPVRIILGTRQDVDAKTLQARAGIDTAHFHVKAVDLYFVPSQDFVDRLPDRYRLPLQNELKLMDRVSKGELMLNEACDLLHKQQDNSLLDLCSSTGTDLSALTVFPNPVRNASMQCSFDAQSEGSYSVSLYNLQGVLQKTLLQTRYRQGTNTITIDMKDIRPGIYVLSLSSEKGVQVTRRIIVD